MKSSQINRVLLPLALIAAMELPLNFSEKKRRHFYEGIKRGKKKRKNN